MDELLQETKDRALAYLNGLADRSVAPTPEALAALEPLDHPLPDDPVDPLEVLRRLDEHGSPATMASAGGRFFGFVVGGALPATVAASWLAGAWDQNAGMATLSPAGAFVEEIAERWLVDVLGLAEGTVAGFCSGATMANFTGLVAARDELCRRAGWDVGAQGLIGAPPLRVVVSDEVHASVLKALALAGFGRERLERVPTDSQGRMRADALPKLDERTLLCLQCGNVNTGGIDPADAIVPRAHEAGAWVHADGAFGLWAAAAPARRELVRGYDRADSLATDGHKWLNVPYDSGMVFCRHPEALRRAMAADAAYLVQTDRREPSRTTPELSRRGRGIEVWAALASLGRRGLAELVERNCRQAARFAAGLRDAGFRIGNEVDLNQVLVSFGDAERTRATIARLQADGTCWCGGTVWRGESWMRISVSSWRTTDEDVEAALAAIIRSA